MAAVGRREPAARVAVLDEAGDCDCPADERRRHSARAQIGRLAPPAGGRRRRRLSARRRWSAAPPMVVRPAGRGAVAPRCSRCCRWSFRVEPVVAGRVVLVVGHSWSKCCCRTWCRSSRLCRRRSSSPGLERRCRGSGRRSSTASRGPGRGRSRLAPGMPEPVGARVTGGRAAEATAGPGRP